MTSSLYLVRSPLQQVEQSLLVPGDVASPVIGIEKALSPASTNFAEVLCENQATSQFSGQPLTADDLLELAFSCPKVIVL
ncbi:hypothetical protein ACO9S2_07705 [Nitrospira sp. NS4]|uniref:hypothetical protein n=1 Tax=Nitrospira sp. NS4 TaxID=3414498 RepID=UPI003C30BF85